MVGDSPDTPSRPAITVTEASPKKSKKPPPVPAKKASLTRMRAPSFDESDSEPRADAAVDGTAVGSEAPT